MRAEEASELETARRELLVDGVTWRVTSEGRARVRAGGGTAAPLILVVFEAKGREALEALVVGRRLEEVAEDRLLEALAGGRPHRADPESTSFFEGTRPREPRR